MAQPAQDFRPSMTQCRFPRGWIIEVCVIACPVWAVGGSARAAEAAAQEVIEEEQAALDGTVPAMTGGPVRARRRCAGPIIKFIMKTRPGRLWVVKREMLRRIKNRFDELEVEISASPKKVLVAGIPRNRKNLPMLEDEFVHQRKKHGVDAEPGCIVQRDFFCRTQSRQRQEMRECLQRREHCRIVAHYHRAGDLRGTA